MAAAPRPLLFTGRRDMLGNRRIRRATDGQRLTVESLIRYHTLSICCRPFWTLQELMPLITIRGENRCCPSLRGERVTATTDYSLNIPAVRLTALATGKSCV